MIYRRTFIKVSRYIECVPLGPTPWSTRIPRIQKFIFLWMVNRRKLTDTLLVAGQIGSHGDLYVNPFQALHAGDQKPHPKTTYMTRRRATLCRIKSTATTFSQSQSLILTFICDVQTWPVVVRWIMALFLKLPTGKQNTRSYLVPPRCLIVSVTGQVGPPPSQTEDFYQAIDSNRIRTWINSCSPWARMQGMRVSGGGHAKTKCQIDGMAPVRK